MYAGALKRCSTKMLNSLIMPGRIRNETEYKDACARLKAIYREIMKLLIKKEGYEEQIDAYLKNKQGGDPE